jgi:hypothetical protein
MKRHPIQGVPAVLVAAALAGVVALPACGDPEGSDTEGTVTLPDAGTSSGGSPGAGGGKGGAGAFGLGGTAITGATGGANASGGAATTGASGGSAAGGAATMGASGGATPTAGSGGQAAAAGGAGGGAGAVADSGTLIPLYTSPGHPSWATVKAAKLAHPRVAVVAVVNPSSGPGNAASSAYTSGIADLTAAGVKVIGYVYTDYGRRAATTVQADIDRWRMFYPQVSGIFFDEQAYQPGSEAYYRQITAYARAAGLPFTVGNPGVDSNESYVGTVDLILIYESAGLPPLSRLMGWHTKYDRRGFGVIPHAVPSLDAPSFVASIKPYVGFIYVQSDTLPNPWDSVPSYFPALVAALDQ